MPTVMSGDRLPPSRPRAPRTRDWYRRGAPHAWHLWALALVLVAAAGSGAWLLYDGSQSQHPPQPAASDAFPPAAAITATPHRSPVARKAPGLQVLPASVPVRIKIAEIKVDAAIAPLDLDDSGKLQSPDDRNQNLAGWYRGGTSPGAAGNAIMDGHVDTEQGPAVFFDLGALHKGNTIEIDRSDHTAALFTIDAIEVYEKNAFPSTQVYGPTKNPQLRLITCGGGYSRSTGYLGNVVLYAHLTGSKRI